MYSAAFNNYENLEGSADPKTGMYSFRHAFGSIQANGTFGPKCNLMMSYNLLSTMGKQNSTGLGNGWSFRLGSYQQQSQTLTLNTGASYKVLAASESEPWKLSQKLCSIKVIREKAHNEIHIYHKNGDTEILKVDSSSGDATLSRFISANGRYLRFRYQEQFGYKRLMAVHDRETNTDPLATITYDDDSGRVVVVTHPGTPDSCATLLNISSGGLLDRIVLPDKKHIGFRYAPYDFEHNDNVTILYQLKQVSYPTGATEEMEYEEKLYLPINAPIPFTPAISKHIKTVATNQPLIVTTFNYGQDGEEPGRNYWGYGSGVVWDDYTDGLFNYPSKYQYSSEVSCGAKVTKCNYNKFHQTISKIETNGKESHKIITHYEYYSDEEKVLEDQPVTYELMKKETVHFERSSDVSQDFVRSYEYDQWGNVTAETDISGVNSVSEYYSPEGGEGCPAHPFGMVAYVKQRSHHPCDGSPSKTILYAYQSIPSLGSGTTIVPLTASYGNTTESYTYFDSSDATMQGMLKSHTTVIGSIATTKSCSYKFDESTVLVTNTVTGYDGASLSTSNTLSFWTGVTKRKTDEAGIVKVYTHDHYGRLLTETIGVDTDYEIKTTYTYRDNPMDPSSTLCIGMNVVQETDSGATVSKYYDGEHRELEVYQKDEHCILRKLSEKNYDNQGRRVSESELDYVISETDGSIEKTMCEKATYVYDSWGHQSETHHDNGTIEISARDPINRKTTLQVVRKDDAGNVTDSLNSVVTTQDLFGNPTSTEVFTKTGESYSTTCITCDGFGRKRNVIAPTGETAMITEYDEFDRPTEFKHYDGTIFQISYAGFVSESFVSSISVPSLNATLGERKYDSFLRVTSRTVGGVETQFGYTGGFDLPSRRVNASGSTTLFDYIPELEMQTSRVASFANTIPVGAWDDSSKISESIFTYGREKDATLGRIFGASSSTSHYSYSYTKTGVIKATTQTVGRQSQTVTDLKSTMAGKSLSVKIGDRIVSYEYDESGQIISTTDGDIKIEMNVDDFGRLSSKTVKHYNPTTQSYDLVQSTITSYDEHSREVLRTISVKKSGLTYSIKSAYDVEDKLVQCITSTNDGDSLTQSFTYDSKKRLLKYSTSNSTTDVLLPRNENGKPFLSQSFAFDGLDNITSIETAFPNGDTDTATFTYDTTHRQKLLEVSHTLTTEENAYPSSLTLQYDVNGNLTSYKDCEMSYTVSGRLSKKNETVYTYDPFDKLVQSNETVRIYSGHQVVQEITGTNTTDFIRCGDIPVGEIRKGQVKIYGVDQKLSVVSVTNGTSTACMNYSSYGSGDNGARIGMNGELRDVTDSSIYHLGNGTRIFFPALCGFSSTDTFSPFLGGGINPFKYCGLDPINAIDPSGHVSFLSIFGLFVAVVALIAVPFTGGTSLAMALGAVAGVCGVVSAGLNIGSEVANDHGNTKLAKKLGIASAAFGAAGAVFSIGQIAADVGNVVIAAREARLAAKAATRSNLLIEGSTDVDNLVTTGYTRKFGIARQSMLANDDNEFMVIKAVKRRRGISLTFKQKIIERKFGSIYIRSVKTPIRVIRGGKYAGMVNILSKSQSFSRIIIRGLFGSPVTSIAQSSQRIHNLNRANATKHDDDDEEHDQGVESVVNMSLFSAFGLPVAKKSMGAERMLFNV